MKRIIEIVVDFKNKMYNVLSLKQLDTTVIKVKLLDNNIKVDLTSQTVDIIFTKPDNTIVQQLASDIDINNGIATIPLLENCLRQHGKAKMEIEVKNTNSEVISSFYVPVFIERTSKEDVASDDMPLYFEEFSKAIDDLKEESDTLVKNLSEIDEDARENEALRLSAEELRIQKENERLAAEELRIQKENERLAAEELRIQKENERLVAEELRIQKENERLVAEESRIVKFAEIVNNMDVRTVERFINNFANIYSSELTYSIGDYCLHENLFYKCITAIAEPEEFDSTKWMATTMANELKNRLEFEVVKELDTTEVISE